MECDLESWLDTLGNIPPIFVGGDFISWSTLLNRAQRLCHKLRGLGAQSGHLLLAPANKSQLLEQWIVSILCKMTFVPLPSNCAPPESLPSPHDSCFLWDGQEYQSLPLDQRDSVPNFLPALLLSTSGTSKNPRWVAYRGSALLQQLTLHAQYLAPYLHAQRLQLLPLVHAFGILDLALGLHQRQELILMDSSLELLGSLPPLECLDMALTPRLAYLLTSRAMPFTMGTLHLAGGRFSSQLLHQVDLHAAQVIEGYGLTECGLGVMLEGKPLGCDVKLFPIATGAQPLGLLHIKSPFMGWWSGCEESFNDGWYNTYDLAYHTQGKWRILGRYGRLLKLRTGEWIGLDALESSLEESLNLSVLKLEAQETLKVTTTVLEERQAQRLHNRLRQLFDYPIQFSMLSFEELSRQTTKGL